MRTGHEVDLRGRSILVVCPRFFGYERRIVEHLTGRGARVRWLDERPGNSTALKSLTRLSPRSMAPVAERHYGRALGELAGTPLDDILFVNPESSTPAVVRRFRTQHPGSRILLYMWDSFENKPRARAADYIGLFDRVFTFDAEDARTYGIGFRPLFYADDGSPPETGRPEFAFSFVGTIHSDRYRIVQAVAREAERSGLRGYVYAYLQSRLLYGLYRATKPEFRGTRLGDFRFAPLPYAEVLRIMRASSAIIDVEHPRQRGLTMRTFEVLGTGRKLVTTNARIREYPFFSEDRIWVLDRREPRVDPAFLRGTVRPLPPEFAAEYGIAGWIDAIFR